MAGREKVKEETRTKENPLIKMRQIDDFIHLIIKIN